MRHLFLLNRSDFFLGILEYYLVSDCQKLYLKVILKLHCLKSVGNELMAFPLGKQRAFTRRGEGEVLGLVWECFGGAKWGGDVFRPNFTVHFCSILFLTSV